MAADGTFPSRRLHGDNSVRYTVRGVELKDGAAPDYLEVGADAD